MCLPDRDDSCLVTSAAPISPGLEGLHDLRELVLDRNKIKTLADNSFVSQWNLQELHIEENRCVRTRPLLQIITV